MVDYTLCLLLRTNLSEGDCNKFLQDLSETLNSQTKPKITSWGKRDLAYPINKETQASYYFLNFEVDSNTPSKLDKKLRLEDKVLRFLIVKEGKKVKKLQAAEEITVAKETKVTKTKKATNVTKETKEKKAKAKKARR